MDNAGSEHDRQRCSCKRPHQRAHPANPAGLAFRRKIRQPQIDVSEIGGRGQRQPVSGRSGDQIERPRLLENVHEHCRIGQRLGCRKGLIEKDAAIVEAADVDADGPRVDSDHTGHGGWLNFR